MNELHYLDENVLPILYMLAAAGFILAIKWMNSPATARRGVIVGEIGMLLLTRYIATTFCKCDRLQFDARIAPASGQLAQRIERGLRIVDLVGIKQIAE